MMQITWTTTTLSAN